MMRRACIALLLISCSRVEEPDYSARSSAASVSSMASASASVSSSAFASASASTSAPPPASASASAAVVSTPFEGTWVFSRFDLTDPSTAAKWSAVPADAQADILATAPQATLVIGKGTIVTKLAGVPDKKSTFTVDAGSTEKQARIVTNDDGRKKLSLLSDGAMRVEDLDKKDSFVTIFVRKK